MNLQPADKMDIDMTGSGAPQRVLITGISGMLGRNVAEYLLKCGDIRILALVRAESRRPLTHQRLEYKTVDFSDRHQLREIIDLFGPTCIVHSAASGMHHPRPGLEALVQFNVCASVTLCELAACYPGCRFIYIGSGLAYGGMSKPVTEADALSSLHPYGATKAAADIVVRSACNTLGVPLIVLRPFSFSGHGDFGTRLFPSLLRAAAEGRAFDMTAGDQVRDHCAVDDIARGVTKAIMSRDWAEPSRAVYNLGSGATICLRELVENVIRDIGLNVNVRFGARPAVSWEPRFLVADTTRAREELDWVPEVNFSHAIWQLAIESFPSLKLIEPSRLISHQPLKR